MLSLLKNGGFWDFYRQEESSNSLYHQPKDCSEANWKDFYDRHWSSVVYFNFNCHSQDQWFSLWAWFFASSWDYVLGRWNSLGSDCFNREIEMSFIAQDFDKLNIITVLESRTQAIIRNPMNTRLSSDTESSFNKIVRNWVINDFIALLFVCTWLIKKF